MRMFIGALAAFWVASTVPALATGCFPIAQNQMSVQVASMESFGVSDPGLDQLLALADEASIEIRYLGHSSYHIETKDGIRAITDYYGLPMAELPDIATMNNAHSTHYTLFPDPQIKHVLHGWGDNNGMAEHDLEVGDLRVRNIPTSVHGRTGGQTNSNSIFVFEVGDLCVAHLGHLHHVLEDVHLAELGIIDIVMVPIDGVYTMSQIEMAEVIEQIDPAIVLPMHYFGGEMIARFAAILGDKWELKFSEERTAAFSRLTLPNRQILVLPIAPG